MRAHQRPRFRYPKGAVGPIMTSRSSLLVFLCVSLFAWIHAMGSDEQAIQREALAESLEQPLRAELIENGYSPRNAAIAASSMLDMYAQCLASTHNANMDSEPEVTNVWLGGLAVTVYRSDCLTEFLDNVADLP